MNKNIKTEFLIDKFVDYTGKEREFILAAVSVPLLCEDCMEIPDIESFDGEIYDDARLLPLQKLLLIGISVCNAEDKFDEEIGKRIAVGKALKFKGKCLALTDAGLANTTMIEALLKQEATYFKRNPESCIAGYSNAEKRWKEKQSLQQV